MFVQNANEIIQAAFALAIAMAAAYLSLESLIDGPRRSIDEISLSSSNFASMRIAGEHSSSYTMKLQDDGIR